MTSTQVSQSISDKYCAKFHEMYVINILLLSNNKACIWETGDALAGYATVHNGRMTGEWPAKYSYVRLPFLEYYILVLQAYYGCGTTSRFRGI